MGIKFLWKGSSPDSRDLNIIPLTFSYKLVNDDTQQEFPHPVYDDSNRVTGYKTGWSPWTSASQVTFTASMATRLDPAFRLDGTYKFYVRVRDDGLTESDTVAVAVFRAVAPTFHRQLLIVDRTQTQQLTPDRAGMVDDVAIKQFYLDKLPGAFQTAEAIRAAIYTSTGPTPSSTMGNRCNGSTTKFLPPEPRALRLHPPVQMGLDHCRQSGLHRAGRRPPSICG